MFETPWVQRDPTPNFLQTFREGRADAQAQQDRASQQNAFQQYARDPQAGIKAALMAGDPKSAETMRGFQAQDAAAQEAAHARKLAATAHFAGQLYDASRTKQDVGQAFDLIAPDYARELGATPQEMAQLRQTAIANPEMMGVLSGNAAKQFEQFTLKQGESRIDGTGKVIASVAPEMKVTPIAAGGSAAVTGGPGGQGLTMYGQGGQAGATGPTPAPSGGAYDRVAGIAQQRGASPAETDYLRRTLKIESHGNPNAQNGSSTGLFQFHPDTFASVLPGGNINDPNDQVQATLNLARRDQATLQKIGVEPSPANLYIMHQQGPGGGPALLKAPPEVGAVAALTPVYGSAAMARKAIVGNGGTPDMTAGQFVDMWRQKFDGAPSAPAGPAGIRMIQGNPKEPKPQYRLATAAENTAHGYPADAKAQVSPDGKYEPQAVDPNAAAPVLGDPNLTGEAFLKTLPLQDRQMIKLMVQGKVPPPTGLAMSKPQVQARLAAAAQYDPSFDESKWKARTVARADVATGQTHKTIQQLGTVMSHLDDLDRSIDALGNTPFKDINKVSNWIEGKVDNPAPAKFNINKTLASQELRKYFAGGSGGSLEELRSLEDQLDAAKGPKTLHGVLRRIVMLVGDKKDQIERQYADIMGEPLNIDNQLTPKARAAYLRMGGESFGSAPSAPQRAQPRPMPQQAQGARLSVEQAAKLKPGTPFIGMDGVPRVRH